MIFSDLKSHLILTDISDDGSWKEVIKLTITFKILSLSLQYDVMKKGRNCLDRGAPRRFFCITILISGVQLQLKKYLGNYAVVNKISF